MDPNQDQGTIDERIAQATVTEAETNPITAEEKQAEPTPSSDQTTEEVISDVVDMEEKEALDNSKNPDRTKAYIEKLKLKLQEAESKAVTPQTSDNYGDSVFDMLKQGQNPAQADYAYLNQQQVDQTIAQFIDEDGNVDVNGLNATLRQQNEMSRQALDQARFANEKVARFEESQQLKELYVDFPQLDPLRKESFDARLYDLVRDRIMRNYVQGVNQHPLEVARDVSGYKPQIANEDKVKAQAVADYEKAQQARNQGPIEAGKGETRDTAPLEELRQRTRQGDPRALDERLKALGIL